MRGGGGRTAGAIISSTKANQAKLYDEEDDYSSREQSSNSLLNFASAAPRRLTESWSENLIPSKRRESRQSPEKPIFKIDSNTHSNIKSDRRNELQLSPDHHEANGIRQAQTPLSSSESMAENGIKERSESDESTQIQITLSSKMTEEEERRKAVLVIQALAAFLLALN
jgi:hypothetical protein